MGSRDASGVVKVRPCSPERRQRWADVVERFEPEVVVDYLANAGGLGEVRIDGEWVMDCDPAFEAPIGRPPARQGASN